MQNTYPVTELIQKVVDSSFFVTTPKGTFRVVSGELFHHKGKYFYLEDVLYEILRLYKYYGFSEIDTRDLHDMLYASYIDDKEVLNAIKSQ